MSLNICGTVLSASYLIGSYAFTYIIISWKKTKTLSITEYYCIGNKPGNILLLSGKGCIHIILHENVIKYKNENSNLLK